MNTVVEQIVSSDETSRRTVEQAEKDAATLLADARREAGIMMEMLEKQIRESEQQEILPIVSEAKQTARHTIEQAERYMSRLNQKVAEKKGKIVADCVTILLEGHIA